MNPYQIITQEVKRDSRIPFDDKMDFVHSVYVIILETKPQYITRSYIRRIINNLIIDQSRASKARPTLIFNDIEYGGTGLLPESEVDAIERQIDVLARTERAQRAKRD